MVERVALAGADDPVLRDYVRLRDVQARRSLEVEHGFFIAEGEKVVRRALESGHRPRSFLMAPRWLESLADVLDDHDVPCYVLSEAAIERVTGFHVHRGALASLERPAPRAVDDVLATARRIVVIEDVVDHTNVGAIFRSVAALGFDAIMLSPRCADPLYRRSIKVAMGSVFWLPYARLDKWYEAPDLLARHGFQRVALALDDAATDLARLQVGDKVALLVGSEGHGLSPRWRTTADDVVMIPMAADIDSLNVAASVAVACWALREG
ncbi:TrmH family RNA methyltransferase [Solicola gregarius]|uniref:RNA methyltransferase n=1 Tax=Solicola gregarius TaxID=2908642 RepID=A0AA46THM0_9ACTN|nr:RNA methyltransferase [Solicola gregarius]UYM04982.1 RNA methyltransferase [Solicola gregarius]